MEELQTTEILEREILEDARKKALRILKTADEAVQAKTAQWESRAAAGIEELEKRYGELKKQAAEKTMARLPVDKLRAKVEKIESLLADATGVWYRSLSRRGVVELLTGELYRRLEAHGGFPPSAEINAYYSALERGEAEAVLRNVKVDCSLEERPADGAFPSITLDTAGARVTASIRKAVDFLLQEKREELVEALVGRSYMEGA